MADRPMTTADLAAQLQEALQTQSSSASVASQTGSGPLPQSANPMPLPESEQRTRVVMEHRLWDMGEQLRNIRWPKKWLDRVASGFTAIAVASLGGAVANTQRHSALLGHENGYYIAAAISGIFAAICYLADKDTKEEPETTVARVVKKMEDLKWITSQTETRPKKSIRWWIVHNILRLNP
jgi:hypothetical protein